MYIISYIYYYIFYFKFYMIDSKLLQFKIILTSEWLRLLCERNIMIYSVA